MNYILRRRRLGLTSCREITRLSTTGITFLRNDATLPQEAGYVFRWGCTSTIPSGTVVNTAAAIHAVADKKNFRLLLDEHDLCPATWGDLASFEQQAPVEASYIVRPARHAQGRHVDLCTSHEEVRAACAKYPDHYIAEFIPKEREFRVMVIQGRVAWVAEKFPDDAAAIAWNVARGGRFENVRWGDWPLKACRVAIQAFYLSGLDFGGVDIMSRGNDVYVLEINSAPSLTSPYRQECTAKCFDWIVTHGKTAIPLLGERGAWRKFAHPALDEQVWR